MITSYAIKNPLQKIINIINRHPRSIQSVALVHGSASRLNKFFYVSDIDVEYWMRFQENKKELYQNFLDVINLMIQNNMYFHSLLTGIDDRFIIDAYLRKDGTISNYNPIKIKKQYNDLYSKKIITKVELNGILKHITDKPTLISFKKLKNKIKDNYTLNWTLDEIIKGKKIFKKKTFILYDLYMKHVILSNFVFEYEVGNYVLFDLAFRIFNLPEKYTTLYPPHGYTQYDFLIDKSNIYGEISRRTTSFYYESIFRNYIQGKYLKMIKRIRSMLSEYIYRPNIINIVNHNLNKQFKEYKYKDLLKKLRYDIQKFTKSKKISCLNQLKNRIDTIIILTEYKPELEIKRLTINILKDSNKYCEYYPESVKDLYNILNNYDKSKLITQLKKFKKKLFEHLNELALPYLIEYINRLQFILPFKLVLPLPDNKNT